MALTCPSTRSQVLLQWLRKLPSPFHLLSSNITREVCSYLSARYLVPAALNSTLRVYDIEQRTVTVGQLTAQVSTASVPCMLDCETVMYVGGYSPYVSNVLSVNLVTFQVNPLQSMLEARGWAGVINYNGIVYVFGGNNPQIASAERYDIIGKSWKLLPQMGYARYSFTPVLYKAEIYLADCMIRSKVIEVFTPLSEKYRELSVLVPDYGSHSVSFLLNSELYIISLQFSAGKMPLEPGANPEFTNIPITTSGSVKGYVGSPPLILEKKVYFAHYTEGNLTVFDVDKATLYSINEFFP